MSPGLQKRARSIDLRIGRKYLQERVRDANAKLRVRVYRSPTILYYYKYTFSLNQRCRKQVIIQLINGLSFLKKFRVAFLLRITDRSLTQSVNQQACKKKGNGSRL